MTFALILFYLVTYVAGQLLLKIAMNKFDHGPKGAGGRSAAIAIFTASILSMAVSFFVNLGLLQKLDLSYLFPFQGLSVIIIAAASVLFLREQLSIPLIIGVLLITSGVILVSSS
jgi:uncharacterized membrane protein